MCGVVVVQLIRADNNFIKNQNLSLVLNVVRTAGSISRTEISKRTGLSRSTVSQLVSYLLDEGIVEEAGAGNSVGGRRPIMLQIKPEGRLVCAIHVDDEGRVYARAEDLAKTVSNEAFEYVSEPAELVTKLVNTTRTLVKDKFDRIAAIVLALPGVISSDGTIVSAVNLGWRNIPVSAPLSKALGVPVHAENATGLAAYGELMARKGDVRNLIYLKIGSVVGAGVITNAQLHHGLRGSAAEIGHMVMDPQGPLCKCGRRGCLEAKVNRHAVFNLLREEVWAEALDHDKIGESNVFEWLVENDSKGEPAAQKILRAIGRDVAGAIVNVLNILGPEAIVLESSLCDSATFWEALTDKAASEVLPFAEGRYQILPSLLGNDAVLSGALAYARDCFYEQSRLYTKGS